MASAHTAKKARTFDGSENVSRPDLAGLDSGTLSGLTFGPARARAAFQMAHEKKKQQELARTWAGTAAMDVDPSPNHLFSGAIASAATTAGFAAGAPIPSVMTSTGTGTMMMPVNLFPSAKRKRVAEDDE